MNGRKKMRKSLILLLTITLFTNSAFAADGDLDTSFDGDGKVSTDVGANYDSAINAVEQTDGKIVTVGTTRNTDSSADPDNLLVVRYNTNGSLDTSFGTDGKVIVINTTSVITNFGLASGLALQSDGKILVTTANGRRGTLFRFNADGSRDTAFGDNGLLSLPNSGSEFLTFLSDVAVLPSGKILVAGAANNNTLNQAFGLARLNQDGLFDTAFGTGGIVRTSFTVGTTAAAATEISLASNGKILLGGSINPQTTPAQVGIAVYNADGSPDTTFNTSGKLLVATANANLFSSIAWQADGKIVTVGRKPHGDSGQAPYFQRITSGGMIDTAFGTNGEVFPMLTNLPLINLNDVAIQPDGKILGFGNGFVSFQGGLTSWLTVVRLSPNGAFDSTFGSSGIVATPFNTSFSSNQSQALTGFLQSDGKIVAAGFELVFNSTTFVSNVNIAIARYSNTAVNPALRYADFDGDGKADISLYRSGTWFMNPSGNPNLAPTASYQVQFGIAGDVPMPVDFDGDGRSDVAVWRGSTGVFYILNSATNTIRSEQFGLSGDNPTVSGDWDGDGKADVATYRGGVQSFFYYRGSLNNPSGNVTYLPWGTSGDTPIFGDFDGDRKLDTTVYRPSENRFYVRNSSNGTVKLQQWGTAATDAIFAGDFDGDGKSDFAVQRFSGAEAGTWFVQQSSGSPSFRAFKWGLGSDVPVPADYDGDGKMDFAVYRRSNGTWYIYRSETGTVQYSQFGLINDFPVPLTYVR